VINIFVKTIVTDEIAQSICSCYWLAGLSNRYTLSSARSAINY